MEQNRNVKTHKVGTLTAGILLLLLGLLFLVRLFVPTLNYLFIFRCWPCVLILLGVEMIIASRRKEEVVYDAGAIFLVIVLAVFSMGMAGVDMLLQYAVEQGYSIGNLF